MLPYRPTPLFLGTLRRLLCVDCKAAFETQCPIKVRCDRCARARQKEKQRKANQRFILQRRKQKARLHDLCQPQAPIAAA